MLTVVYAIVLYVCIKKGALKDADTYVHYKQKKYNAMLVILGSSIIILGIGAISILWINLAESHLSFIPIFEESIQSFDETWSDLEETPYIFIFLSVAFVGPIVEEILFRGIILESMRKIMPPALAIFFSSMVFGIWHMEPIQVVYTIIAGIAFGVVYYRTRKLRYPILMHIINNFTSALPPQWDTQEVNDSIFHISLLCILPAIILLIGMARKEAPFPKRLQRAFTEVSAAPPHPPVPSPNWYKSE